MKKVGYLLPSFWNDLEYGRCYLNDPAIYSSTTALPSCIPLPCAIYETRYMNWNLLNHQKWDMETYISILLQLTGVVSTIVIVPALKFWSTSFFQSILFCSLKTPISALLRPSFRKAISSDLFRALCLISFLTANISDESFGACKGST